MKKKREFPFKGDINDLLRGLGEWEYLSDTINEEVIGWYKKDSSIDLTPIKGFKWIIESDGKHRTDGCTVGYDIFFTSPTGEEWGIYTKMNLVRGWDVEYSDIVFVG